MTQNNNINNDYAYDFPVEMVPIYVKVRSSKGDSFEEVKIDKSKKKAVMRSDTNEVLGVCTDRYKLIKHTAIMDYVASLIRSMGYLNSETEIFLWKSGAILHSFSELSDKKFVINGSEYGARVVASNSYNGSSTASISVRFVNEKTGTILGDGINVKDIMTLSSQNIAKHMNGSVSMDEFDNFVKWIPELIDKMVDKWRDWANIHISGDRLKKLSQLLPYPVAKAFEQSGLFIHGCSRFEFYNVICSNYVNISSFATTGKSGTYALSKFKNVINLDSLYNSSTPEIEIDRIVNVNGMFSWDDPDLGKKKTRRTKVAYLHGALDNYVNEVINADESELDESEEFDFETSW